MSVQYGIGEPSGMPQLRDDLVGIHKRLSCARVVLQAWEEEGSARDACAVIDEALHCLDLVIEDVRGRIRFPMFPEVPMLPRLYDMLVERARKHFNDKPDSKVIAMWKYDRMLRVEHCVDAIVNAAVHRHLHKIDIEKDCEYTAGLRNDGWARDPGAEECLDTKTGANDGQVAVFRHAVKDLPTHEVGMILASIDGAVDKRRDAIRQEATSRKVSESSGDQETSETDPESQNGPVLQAAGSR